MNRWIDDPFIAADAVEQWNIRHPPEPMKPENNKSALLVQEGGDHYKKMPIQPVEYIHANHIPFMEGCIIKYISRWKNKGGIQDLEKAKHFINLLIELESKSK